MQYITFRVVGTSPLLMHNPAKMQDKETGPSKRIPKPDDEAEAGTYRMPDKQMYFPAAGFRASLVEGGSSIKVKRTTAKKILSSALFVTGETCPLVNPATDEPISTFNLDVRRAVIQGQGIIRARPRVEKWATTVEFEYDDDFVEGEVILRAFGYAGRIVGVGELRPRPPKGNGGPFGRYTVELIGDTANKAKAA